ncbi:alpha 1,2-mannosyltransferase Smp3, putative [Talaromyces stipitatus ATCC 10500]|uniref:Mannosyltransferase n=1 Tax=Talaromyces stipitatus (strain ATCC 10500 / CBS 375.48 / QM 6759 / NRRL 1006) TaxID=441959 RepID=B8MDP7_TALSN|nr:alpha 1,2-mannosyltransferase Smp3, putative [Talaromyces stipitatus ATCC 10500]EED18276.1 alpha 1,2-mannosyltransferase Smp3, putative [Talaromyces stipitatus ATCC 10500]
MWRRTYLLLLLVRIYFALSPSYVHPDEHFQSLEVFAGRIYSYPSQLTWEFTSDTPIRSVFPLWPVYGLPMNVVKWFYNETGLGGSPPPELIYYILRGGMFVLSFVLEDWAVYELVPTPRYRVPTVVLVASSYVTWTYQTHTFSNSLETLLVTWGLVLIQRIVENNKRSAFFSPAVLSLVVVLGVFNRITFPAFLLIPGLQLVPHFIKKPFAFAVLVGFGSLFSALAILTDTIFYRSSSFIESIRHPVITPLNNLIYNSNSLNLAEHGLHPHYHHFLVNLPQLLGPALVVLVVSLFMKPGIRSATFYNRRAISAVSGTMILSAIPHQEPRFLLPCVPLLLTCIRPLKTRPFLLSWIAFNAILGFLMGVYHQGGVVPTQLAMPSIISSKITQHQQTEYTNVTVFWWKTYSPPLWLLGDTTNLHAHLRTRDLMGMRGTDMIKQVDSILPACPALSSADESNNLIFLVAPRSATFLDTYTSSISSELKEPQLHMTEQWTYKNHLNLDDIDFGDDGVLATIYRVIGRRGLTVWSVERVGCV